MNVTDEKALDVLATNLDRLIKDRDWTPYRLAQESGENPAMVSRILNRKNMPGLGTVTRLAEALEVNLDQLIPRLLQKRKKANFVA